MSEKLRAKTRPARKIAAFVLRASGASTVCYLADLAGYARLERIGFGLLVLVLVQVGEFCDRSLPGWFE